MMVGRLLLTSTRGKPWQYSYPRRNLSFITRGIDGTGTPIFTAALILSELRTRGKVSALAAFVGDDLNHNP